MRSTDCLAMSIQARRFNAVLWHTGMALATSCMMILAQGQARAQSASSIGTLITAETPPEVLIARIQSAAQTVSFSGTYIHQHGSNLDTLKILQLQDGKSIVTKVQALEGRRQEILRTPQETRVYMPDQQSVRVDQAKSARPAFPSMFVGNGADILRHYDLIRGSLTRIADIEAIEITLKPKDELRWPVRVYADPNTGLMVKCQKLDFANHVIEQVAFSDLSLAPKLKPSALKPSYPGYETWPVSEAGMRPVAPMPLLKYKAESLKGFNLIAVYQRDDLAAERGFKMRRYVLTDGVATVSVFVQSKSSAGPLNEDVKRKGALSMLSRPIQDAWVTVMGEIPPDTLRLFAQSIEWKTTP